MYNSLLLYAKYQSEISMSAKHTVPVVGKLSAAVVTEVPTMLRTALKHSFARSIYSDLKFIEMKICKQGKLKI